jgi:hypothetical protein
VGANELDEVAEAWQRSQRRLVVVAQRGHYLVFGWA